MAQLGGHALHLSSANELQIGRGESLRDTAMVLSRYVDALMVRTYAQADIDELAHFASIPVINGLTDDEHPCQALADLQTLAERFGDLRGLRLAYLGDGNNVCRSLVALAAMAGCNVVVATPPGYHLDDASRRLVEGTRRGRRRVGRRDGGPRRRRERRRRDLHRRLRVDGPGGRRGAPSR